MYGWINILTYSISLCILLDIIPLVCGPKRVKATKSPIRVLQNAKRKLKKVSSGN